MTRSRPTYYPTEMLDKISWFKPKILSKINHLSIVKSEDDFRIISILKILYPLKRQNENFSRLYMESGFRMKKSFLTYLNFCQEIKLIEKIPTTHQLQFYKITEKGKKLLELMS